MKHLSLSLAVLAITLAGCGDEETSATDTASEETADEVSPDSLSSHAGYWQAEITPPGQTMPFVVVNDTHVDLERRHVTVYAQQRINGQVLAPPQFGPGECGVGLDGQNVCYHPNAVYSMVRGRSWTAPTAPDRGG